MKLHSLFITPIFSLELEGHKHIIHDIYKLKQEDKEGMPRSNVGGWHSDDEIYNKTEFKPLVGDILNTLKIALITWTFKMITILNSLVCGV